MRTLLWGSLLIVACSDYGLNQKQETVGGGEPIIEVAPGSIQLEGLCAPEERQVKIRNSGSTTLTITAMDVQGDGWVLQPVNLPIRLEPEEATVALLEGSEGDAVLVVSSDDPDQSIVEVPLSATANQPPVVSITTPAMGEVVAEAQDLQVLGTVWDVEDAEEDLVLSWTSDTQGLLYGDPAAADGSSTFLWQGSGRSTGTQTLSLTATDSCGASTTVSHNFCQDGAYTYDALTLSSWNFEGSASWDNSNSSLILTEAVATQVGSAFETSSPVDGALVDIAFDFFIGGGTGADGISLTALDTARMTGFLGGTGCGIGFGGDAPCTTGPALPGWSIEVDTYYNNDADPTTADHVAFMFDGDVDDPALWATLPEIEDTGWHRMEVVVAAPHVRVSIDGVVYLDGDVGGFSFPAYVGFTAGTGGDTNRHLIDELTVTDYFCE